jgi:hypothetical protein
MTVPNVIPRMVTKRITPVLSAISRPFDRIMASEAD